MFQMCKDDRTNDNVGVSTLISEAYKDLNNSYRDIAYFEGKKDVKVSVTSKLLLKS